MGKESSSGSCSLLTVKLIAIAIGVGFTFFIVFNTNWKQDKDSIETEAAPSIQEVLELNGNIHSRDKDSFETEAAPSIQEVLELNGNIHSRGNAKICDLFDGQWVPNPAGPYYTNDTCHFIDDTSNCLRNGRPDTNYLYWKWKPNGCDLPPLDAYKFMSSMRNKAWAFVGDSILRNHMQSLICYLSRVEEPYETYHDETWKSRTFYFPAHNTTVATIWAPLLFKYNIGNKNEYHVHFDTLDPNWTSQYDKYDYIVIANGQWYTKTLIFWDGGKIIGCHDCSDEFNELGIDYPYRRALKSTFEYITSSNHKPVIFFRTWMPSHFEGGQWFSGGYCNRTKPYKEGEYTGSTFDQKVRDIEVEEFEKAVGAGRKNQIQMELLDTFHLSLLRPDGHPGRYRFDHPDKNAKVVSDCLHSCLPGPVDTWTDMIMKIMLDTGIVQSASSEHINVI